MGQEIFNNQDLNQIRDHGLTVKEVLRHLDLFKTPPPYLKLLRPCTPGDGITAIDKKKIQAMANSYELDRQKRRYLKFVPASGAASRMFEDFLRYVNQEKEITRDHLVSKSEEGIKAAQEVLEIMNGIKKFAFFKDLESTLLERGLDIDTLLHKGQFTSIVHLLLSEEGLNYAGLPKALLKFHEYPDGSRTAFEEHMVEAVSYIASKNGHCRIHFTVSREHLEKFEALYKKAGPIFENQDKVLFQVTFSTQKKSTDTLAVGLDNKPFRQKNGMLLFRPGGHGALLEDLNDLQGDIIFIKNIDNIVPDRLKPASTKWKQILCGYLITIQKKIFNYIEMLSSGPIEERFLDQLIASIRKDVSLPLPDFTADTTLEERKAFLMERLNRPLRVCGMVKNEGEPGGGPFWVRDRSGESSLQIVEKGQIDPDSKEQQAILATSTYFNPVDLVCGVRDRRGTPFNLRRYVDPSAVLISQKSNDGKALKALERPGLWNGAMALWNTVFVEVPGITFHPVKTVNDFLRKEHQP